jgi:aryl-alcohol dehydrogenase-like predicted oxidoreductase
MEKRKLGKTSLEIPAIVFGGNVFGWTVDQSESFKLLDAWGAAGFNFIDTAASYSSWVPGNKGGESETIIGNWMKVRGNRNRMLIATKVASEMGPGRKGLSKKYILEAVNDSLIRLQTDYIDLYQAHWPDDNIPHEESLEAFNQLMQEGKIRAFGCSNFSASQLLASSEAAKKANLIAYQTLQPLYNLYDRAIFENELRDICLEENTGVINYYSLASGFLTCKYRQESDFANSSRGAGARKYFTERGLRIVAELESVAAEYHSKPSTVAIAWLLNKPGVTAPIASARTIEQLTELTQASTLMLSPQALNSLDSASIY